METTRKAPTKVLSLFLSVLMAVSCFSIALPALAPKSKAAGVYDELAQAFDAALGAGIMSTSDWGGVFTDPDDISRIVVLDETENGFVYDIVKALGNVVKEEAKVNGDYNRNDTLAAHLATVLGLNAYQTAFVNSCLPVAGDYARFDGVTETWNGDEDDLGNHDLSMKLAVARSKGAAVVADYATPGSVPASVEISTELTITATLKKVAPTLSGAETGGVYVNSVASSVAGSEALTTEEKNQLTALQNYLNYVNSDPFATHFTRWYAEGNKDDNYIYLYLTADELRADSIGFNAVIDAAAAAQQKWIEQFVGQERMNDQATYANKCAAFEGAVSNKKYVDWIMPTDSVPLEREDQPGVYYNARDNYSRTDRASLETALATGVELKGIMDRLAENSPNTVQVMEEKYGYDRNAYAKYVADLTEYIAIYDLQDMKIASDWLLSHDASETYSFTNPDSYFYVADQHQDAQYVLTEDTEVSATKWYYVDGYNYSHVDSPKEADVANYYTRSEDHYTACTSSTVLNPRETYYTYDEFSEKYTKVDSVKEEDKASYYILDEYTYTPAGTFEANKDYYTREAGKVAVKYPVASGLSGYYEYVPASDAGLKGIANNEYVAAAYGFYAKTSDTELVEGKTYYTYNSSTGAYTKVESPAAGSLSSYYEMTGDECPINQADLLNLYTFYKKAHNRLAEVSDETIEKVMTAEQKALIEQTYEDLADEYNTRSIANDAFKQNYAWFLGKMSAPVEGLSVMELKTLAATGADKLNALTTAYNSFRSTDVANGGRYGQQVAACSDYLNAAKAELGKRAKAVSDAVNKYGTAISDYNRFFEVKGALVNLDDYALAQDAPDNVTADVTEPQQTVNGHTFDRADGLLAWARANGVSVVSNATIKNIWVAVRNYANNVKLSIRNGDTYNGNYIFSSVNASYTSTSFTRLGGAYNDFARRQNYYNFTVSTASNGNMRDTVTKIDSFLANDHFVELLGADEQGYHNLNEYIKGILVENVFSDSMISTIVALLFPMLAKLFDEQISGLVNMRNTDLGSMTGGNPWGNLDVYADAQGGKGTNNFVQITQHLGLNIYPSTFGAYLRDSVGSGTITNAYAIGNWIAGAGRNWNNLDQDGDGEFKATDLNKKLKTSGWKWGIDSITRGTKTMDQFAKDRFTKTKAVLGAIFGAANNILKTLFTDASFYAHLNGEASQNQNLVNVYFHPIKLHAETKIVFNVSTTLELTGSLDHVEAGLTLGGVDLYHKLWVPLVEALGVNGDIVPNVNEYLFSNTTSDSDKAMFNLTGNNYSGANLCSALLNPVFALINHIAAKPLESVLKLLPNLAFHLMNRTAYELVRQDLSLKLDLDNVDIDANGALGAVLEWNWVKNIVLDAVRNNVDLNFTVHLGDMLDLDSLLPFDITDLNSLLRGVVNLIAKGDEENPDGFLHLPPINMWKLINACSSKNNNYTTNGGNRNGRGRIYISAANSYQHVLYLLLHWVFEAAKTPGFVADVLSFIKGIAGSDIELPEIVYTILGNITNSDHCIAALVELFNPRDYQMFDINWYNKNSLEGQNDLHLTYTEFVYLNYANDWNQEKAEYLYDNLDSIVNDVINMISPSTLEKYGGDANVWLDSFINSMFSNDGVWNVTDLLVKLGYTLADSPAIAKLIKQQLKGEDASVYNTDLLTWFNTFGYLYADDYAEFLTIDPTTAEDQFQGEHLRLVDGQYYVYVREKIVDKDLSTDTETRYKTFNAADPTTYKDVKLRAYPNCLCNAAGGVSASADNQNNYRPGGSKCSVENVSIFERVDEYGNLVKVDGQQRYDWRIKLTAKTAQFVKGSSANQTVTLVDGGDNARAIFTALICELIGPLAPILSLLLSGKDIVLFDALTLNGYQAYNGALVPFLEALGVTGLPTQAAYAAMDATDAFYEIVNLLFEAMDNLLTDDRLTDPENGKGAFQKLIDVLPHLFYFLQSDGLTLMVKNLLMTVWTLLDTLRPLLDVKLDDVVHALLTRVLNLCVEPANASYAVQPVIEQLLDMLGMEAVPYSKAKCDADAKKVQAIYEVSLETLNLNHIYTIVNLLTGLDVTPLKYCFEGMCIERYVNNVRYGVTRMTHVNTPVDYNDQYKKSIFVQPRSGAGDAFTLNYYGPDVITVTVSVLLDLLQYGSNAAVLDEMIGLVKDRIPGGDDLLTDDAASGLLQALEVIFKDEKHSDKIERPNWDYLFEGQLVKDPSTGNYFNWVDVSGEYTEADPNTVAHDPTKWAELAKQASDGSVTVDLSKYHTLYNLEYTTDWTEDVAINVVDTLEGILDYVAVMMGSDKPFNEWAQDFLNEKVFNANIIGILVDYLAQVYDLIPEAIRGTIDHLLDVNMSGWEESGIVQKYSANDIIGQYTLRNTQNPVEYVVVTYTQAAAYDADDIYYTKDAVEAGKEQTYSVATVENAEAFAAGTYYTKQSQKIYGEEQNPKQRTYTWETDGDYLIVTRNEYGYADDQYIYEGGKKTDKLIDGAVKTFHATSDVTKFRAAYELAKAFESGVTYYEAHEQANGNVVYTVKNGLNASNFKKYTYYTKSTTNYQKLDVASNGAETIDSSYTTNYSYKWFDESNSAFVKDRATFLAAIKEIVHSADSLFGYIFLEDSYKILYTAGDDMTHGNIPTTDNDAIAINGVGLYGLLVVPVLEALKVPLTYDRYMAMGGGEEGTFSYYYRDAFEGKSSGFAYSPKNYYDEEHDTYKTAEWVDDMFIIFEDLTDAILANPLYAILEILPGLIYFINAGGFRTAIKNTFGVLQDLINAVNTVLPEDSQISEIINGINLNNTTLTGLLGIVENLLSNKAEEDSKPKFHINDSILKVCQSLYIGKLEKFQSANGYMSFTMDYSEVVTYDGNGKEISRTGEGKRDMITILVAILVEVLTDKGQFIDPANDYQYSPYDNAAALAALIAEDYTDLVSEIVAVLTDPADLMVEYKEINWKYFDETVDLTPPDDGGAEIQIPFYAYQYLNYTTSWKYDKAVTTVEGIDALAVEILKMLPGDDYKDIETLGDLININTIFTAENAQKMLDFISGFLFGGDSILNENLINLVGAVLGADLTAWNYTYQFADDFDGHAKEGTANGLDYYTADVTERIYAHPTDAFSETESYYQKIDVYTREELAEFAEGVTYYVKTGVDADNNALYAAVATDAVFDPAEKYFTKDETYVVPAKTEDRATAENYTDYYILTDGEATGTRRTYIVNDASSFASAIALILQPAGKLLAWLLFDDPYEFFVGNTDATHYDVLLRIPGADGYRKALALLLEAFGCKNMGVPTRYTSGATPEGMDLSGYDLFLYDLAHSLSDRLLEIANDPVNELIELIPELIYFINANGLGVVVNNLLAGPLALVAKVPSVVALIDEDADLSAVNNVVDDLVAGVLNDALKDMLDKDNDGELSDSEKLTFSMNNVNIKWIMEVVEKLTGLKIPALQTSLDKFFIGKLEAYASKSGTTAYRMIFDDRFIAEHPEQGGNGSKADFLTILLSFVIDIVIYVDEENGIDNGVAIAKLINGDKVEGEDGYINPALIQAIVKMIHDEHTNGTYEDYDWMYFTNGRPAVDGDAKDYSLYDYNEATGTLTRRTTTVGEGENATTVPTTPVWNDNTSIEVGYNAFNYLTYNSDWTEESAKYLVDHRTQIIEAILEMAGQTGTVSDIVKGFFDPEQDLYTAEVLNSILEPIKNLTGSIPEVVEKILGVVLDIDLTAYNSMEAFSSENFTDGNREEFINALTDMLHPLYILLDWLLFGKSITYFDKKTYSGTVEAGAPGTVEVLINLAGADGYKYGLVPLLDALGVEIPTIPEGRELNAETVFPTLLNNILARVEAILSSPVDEVLDMIPELLYFINANGLATAVRNLLGGVFGLVEKVSKTGVLNDLLKDYIDIPEGGDIDITEVVNTLLVNLTGLNLNISKLDLRAILDLVKDLTKQEIAEYEVASITEFAADTTYYTADYEKVDEGAKFDENAKYYIKSGDDYTEVTITEFAEGETYYTASYKKVKATDDFDEEETYYVKNVIASHEGIDLVSFCTAKKIEDFYFGKLVYKEGSTDPYIFNMVYDAEQDMADLITIIVNLAIEFMLDETNAEAIDALINGIKVVTDPETGDVKAVPNANTVGAIVKVLKGLKEIDAIEPEDIDWDYFLVTGELNETGITMPESMFVYLDYSNLWTRDLANGLGSELTDLVNEILAMTADEGEEPQTLQGILSGLVDLDEFLTADILNSILDTIAPLLYGEDSFLAEELLNVVGLILGADLTQWNNTYSFEKFDSAQTYATEPDTGLKYRMGEQDSMIYAIENASDFANGLTLVLKPAQKLIGWLLLGNDYRFFVSKDDGNVVEGTENDRDDNELIVVPGFQGYDYSLTLLLEALGCKNLKKGSEYEGNEAEMIHDVINSVINRIGELLNSNDPVSDLLDLVAELIYFVNAGGLNAVVINLVGGLLEVVEYVNESGLLGVDDEGHNKVIEINGTALDRNIIDTLVADLLNKALKNTLDKNGDDELSDDEKLDFALKDINLDWIIKLAEKLTGFEISDPIGSTYALSKVLIGSVERYDSASSAYVEDGVSQTYRVASTEDMRGDLITILLSVVLDVLQYKDAEHDNAAVLAEMLEDVMDGKITVTVIDSAIEILKGWSVEYSDPNWMYSISDPATYDENIVAGSPVTLKDRTINYLTYGSKWTDAENVTNLWTRDTAEYLVSHIDDVISDVMKLLGQEDTSVAKMLQGVFSVESDLYTADNLNKIVDLVKNLSGSLTAKIKEIVGMVTDVDLAAYDAMHFDAEDINSKETFIAGLVEVLKPIYTLLDWFLFGKDLAFLYDNDFYNNGMVAAEIDPEEGFEDGKTYYTLSYAEVPATAVFNPNAKYFTKSGDTFTAAAITAFAEDVTYYVAEYTKATTYAAGTDYYTDLGRDLINITGGYGYDNAIVPLLEALDIAPVAATKMEDAKLTAVLSAMLTKVEAILADPVNKGLAMLPNLIYFINANGLSVVVGNLIASISGLLDNVVPIIIELVGESVSLGDVTIKFTDDLGNKLSTNEILNNVINGLLADNGIDFEIDYQHVDLLTAVRIIEAFTGLKITEVVEANKIQNFYIGQIEARKSANGKAYFFMSYSDAEGAHDMLTIVLNLVVEVLLYKDSEGNYVNIDALCELVDALKDNKSKIISVIELLTNPTEYEFKELNWNYFDETATLGSQPIFVPKSKFIYLAYQNNWSFDKAATLDETLVEMVDKVIAMIAKDDDPTTLADLIADKVDIDSLIAKPEYLNSILDLLKKYLYGSDAVIGESLLNIVGLLLNAELAEWNDQYEFEAFDAAVHTLTDAETGLKYRMNDDNTKMYYGIETLDDFINGLCKILAPATDILAFILMGKDYGFFTNNEDGTKVLLRINGANGYRNGLAVLLEALGVKGLQAEYEDANVMLKSVLTALVERVREILDNPIDEVLALITELIYFINANGLSVAVQNLAGAAFNILDALKATGFDADLDVDGLIQGLLRDSISEDITFSLDGINIQWIVDLVEIILDKYVAPFQINAVLADSLLGSKYPLEKLAIGQTQKYNSVSEFASAYKMVFAKPEKVEGEYYNDKDGAATRADMITILLSFVLDFLRNEDNQAAIESIEVNGEPLLKAGTIADILAVLTEYTVEITPDVDWFYFDPSYDYSEGADLTMFTPSIQYLSYASDWTEELADYLDTNLDAIVAKVFELIDKDKAEEDKMGSVANLIKGFFDPAKDLYTAENLNKIALAVANLTKDLQDVILNVAGLLLDVDLGYYKSICTYDETEGKFTACTKFADGDITGRETFVEGLKELLAPIYPVLDWLLFGESYKFFNRISSTDGAVIEDLLVINGYEGYAKGLVPILEAILEPIGVKLPDCSDPAASTYNTENMIGDVLSAVLFGVEKILADPVENVLALIPNLLYFINANGLASAVNHLAGAALALVEKVNPVLKDLGVEIMGKDEINVNDLINGLLADNGIDVTIDIKNVRLVDVFQVVEALTGLELTDFIVANGIENFYLGQITYFESSNGEPAFKMVYSEDKAKDRSDLITVLVNYLLEAVMFGDNAKKIDIMISGANDEGEPNKATVESILSMIRKLGTEAVPGDYHWNYFNEESDDVTPETSYDVINTPVTPFNNHLKYTTDWTQKTANTIYDNIDDVITAVMTLIAKGDESKPTTVSQILNNSFQLFTADNLNKIADLTKKLYDNFDASLVNLIGTVLGCDLTQWVGLHYTDEEIYDADTFTAGLYEIVEPLSRVLDWLLFGQSYGFFVEDKNSGTDGNPATTLINVGGANGYIYGLAQILIALGVDLPEYEDGYTCSTDVGGKTFLKAVLDAVVDRVEEILADPVDEALALLPELLYFINANGVSTAAYNLAGGVLNAINVLFQEGIIELKVDDTVYTSIEDYLAASIGIDIRNLDLEGIISFLEAKEITKGIKINDVFKGAYTVNETTGEVTFTYDSASDNNILEKFYCGTVESYVYGGYSGWKMVPAEGKQGDILTMLLSIVLDVLYFEDNEQPIADLINDLLGDKAEFTKDNFIALKALLQNGADFEGNFNPNWVYFVKDAAEWLALTEEGRIAEILQYVGEGKLPEMKERTQHYLEYDNNWNTATVNYLDANINDIVDLVINMVTKGEYIDLEKFIEGKLDLYSADTVNWIVNKLTGALSKLDETLTKEAQNKLVATAGSLLGLSDDVLTAATKPATAAEVHDKATFVQALVDRFSGLNRVLDWLLFNKAYTFFTDLDDGADAMIVLNGGEGYKYGLAPILAALGVDTEISAESCADGALAEILNKVADRIDELLYGGNGCKTLDEVLALLPELIYFINTGAVSEAVMNLLKPADELLKVVNENLGDGAVLGKDSVADFFSFTFNGTEYRLYDTAPATKNYNTIDFDFIFDLVKDKVGIDIANSTGTSADDVPLGKVGDYIKTFYFGQLESYTSYGDVPGYKMNYSDEDTRMDMLTVLVTLVLDVFTSGVNAAAIVDLLGGDEDAMNMYDVIYSFLTGDLIQVKYQKFSWLFEEYADTGIIVSPMSIDGSIVNQSIYGPLYTRPMGEYMTKYLQLLINTYITLLGLKINGKAVFTLEDILNELVGSNIYKNEYLESIYNALLKLLTQLRTETLGEELYNHIANVLNSALGVDLNYWFDEYTGPATITEGDQQAFVDEICKMLRPAYPILRWLLTEDKIALFNKADGTDGTVPLDDNDYLVLNGAKGYKYGILPILEALCNGDTTNIKSYNDYLADDAADPTGDSLLKNILTPILCKVDDILADPINGVLNLLPAVVYFVGSNGLDTCFKNILGSVYTLLFNIDPLIANVDKLHKTDADGKKYVSLYPLIGLDLEDINLESMLRELLDGLKESTGFALSDLGIDLVNELSMGVIESYESNINEDEFFQNMYTMKYAEEGTDIEGNKCDKVDFVTIILRLVLTFISDPDNVKQVEAMLKDKVSEDGYTFLCSLLDNFSQMVRTADGKDKVMYTVYYVFYSALVAGVATNNAFSEFNGNYSFLQSLFNTSDLAFFRAIGQSMYDIFHIKDDEGNEPISPIVDETGVVPQGQIPFWQKIIEFFKQIINFFKNLFTK